MYQDVLNFWFQDIEPAQWWKLDAGFDELIRQRFIDLLQQAVRGELYGWRADPEGRLAEVIVLDQFSRNAYRNTARAFAQDPMALVLAQEAVASGDHRALTPGECTFLLMPYMHSESAIIHGQAEQLFKQFAPDGNYQFELRHKAIIDRFGRYPHRNEMLGRVSSPDEIAFLQQPDSRF